MPRAVSCPTCRAEVKVPRDAGVGTELTCPGCAEVFVPAHLRERGHDPRSAAGYAVSTAEPEPDAERREKARKVKLIRQAGRAARRDERRSGPRPMFGGIEAALLLFGCAAGAAGLIGYVIARRFPSAGEAALVVVGYCGLLFLFAWRKLMR